MGGRIVTDALAAWLGQPPTPLATLISSLLFIGLIAGLYALIAAFRGGKKRREDGFWGRLFRRLGALDKAFVRGASRFTGTAVAHPLRRRLAVTAVLAAIAAAAALIPPLFGLFAVVLGLLAILAVFRHWSRDEDQADDFAESNQPVPRDEREAPIDGRLGIEAMIACLFLLVYAPIAFAQIAASGQGFAIAPDAGPFAFMVYALIELFKAGSLIDYYDLFRDQLPFDRWSDVSHANFAAKGAVLAYRLTVNLLLLAALKRLLDIAQRQSEGRDLRLVRERLADPSVEAQEEGVADLLHFALRGRANALAELERVGDARNGFPPGIRSQAAGALYDYGDQRGVNSALYAAAAVYRGLIETEWTRDKVPLQWAMTQNNLGNALQTLGARESGTARLEEAVAAYRAALEERTRDKVPLDWAMTQTNLGGALGRLGERESGTARLEEAVAAFRAALEERTRDKAPLDWATRQTKLGAALSAVW